MRIRLFQFRRSKYHIPGGSACRCILPIESCGPRVHLFSSQASDPPPDIPRAYDSRLFEDNILQKWGDRKHKDRPNAPVFRMILPPPNVTGKLHLGHALTLAVEDMIARWKVMKGFKVEWIPGFDHAGIATHSVVNRKLQKASQSQAELESEIQKFAEENMSSIKEQMKVMGAILDWDSSYYTLDTKHSQTVVEAFVHLFEAGLIKRGDGMINWSGVLGSSVADVEVDHVEFKGKTTIRVPGYEEPVEFGVLHYIRYAIENSDETVVVATSRPETMFGDVALAINPVDSRYSKFIGMTAINPLDGGRLPIIGDMRVKTDFGSGIVKITPAHDKLDFAVGHTHHLEKLNILTENGLLNEKTGSFQGVPRFTARHIILNHLKESGAFEGSKDYSGAVGLCSRTGDVIEPRILPHWFLQTRFLTEKFVEAIKKGEFVIAPDHHCQMLLNQLAESQDWCLSRQISWGHSIPAYHHVNHPHEWVSAVDLKSAKKKLENKLKVTIKSDSEVLRDSDVLDTWFSSALIPLSVSGWPDTEEFKKISLMETGSDILLFWVWRMAIVTLGLINTLPFNHVLLHGIVTDHYGRKMSKSRGNVIDPKHVVKGVSFEELMNDAKVSFDCGDLAQNEYDLRVAALQKDYPQGFKANGTDALRFSLLSQDIFSQEIKMDIKYLENCSHFSNKMWQALRFHRMHTEKLLSPTDPVSRPNLSNIDSVADQWLLACLYDFCADVESHLNTGRFHLYAEAIRKFFYQQLCDIYIELIKGDFKTGDNATQHAIVMRFAIATGLKLIHPLMPFASEEMWSHLMVGSHDLVIDQEFPSSKELEEFRNPKINDIVDKTMKIVKEIRSAKNRVGIKPKDKPLIYLEIPSTGNEDLLKMVPSIETLARSEIRFENPPARIENNPFVTILFQLNDQRCRLSTVKGDMKIDPSAEKDKILKLQKKLTKIKQQYDNPSFQKYAPSEVKEKLRKKIEVLQSLLNLCDPSLNSEESQSPPNPSHPQ